MQDLALVHLRQACTVEPGQLGEVNAMKRVVEGLLPEVSQQIEEIRAASMVVLEEEKELDVQGKDKGKGINEKPLIGLVFAIGESLQVEGSLTTRGMIDKSAEPEN